MSVRASYLKKEEIHIRPPYGWNLDTSTGEHLLVLPIDGAVSMYYALRDVLREQGVELQ